MTDRRSTFHAGLTPAVVVDAAVELTRSSHLFSWSMRDLASRLGVAPSVIYHHIGGKDRLCRQVVERVLDQLELPPHDLGWQDWFRALDSVDLLRHRLSVSRDTTEPCAPLDVGFHRQHLGALGPYVTSAPPN